jgi:hypothetical protein
VTGQLAGRREEAGRGQQRDGDKHGNILRMGSRFIRDEISLEIYHQL